MVVGDGRLTLKELIELNNRARQLTRIYFPRHQHRLDWIPPKDEKVPLVFAGNHSKGAIFKDGNQLISPALVDTFDRISKKIPSFSFGRFDIRYASFEQLEKGLDFKIVEINGASAESTHIWDANYSLLQAWKDLFNQFRLLFIIGEHNMKCGVHPQALRDFLKAYLREKKLSAIYPGTH